MGSPYFLFGGTKKLLMSTFSSCSSCIFRSMPQL